MSDAVSSKNSEWESDWPARWLAGQNLIERMLKPPGDALLRNDQLRSIRSVLDIGCGGGVFTTQLAGIVPLGTRIMGADISESVIKLARGREPQGPNKPEFVLLDVAKDVVGDIRFDAVTSRFGPVMFFEDPAVGCANIRKMMTGDAVFLMTCWQSADANEWFEFIRDTISPFCDFPEVSEVLPGPFALGNRDKIAGILRDAGFRDIGIEPFYWPFFEGLGDGNSDIVDDLLNQALQLGPLPGILARAEENRRLEIIARVKAALQTKVEEGIRNFRGAAWTVTALTS